MQLPEHLAEHLRRAQAGEVLHQPHAPVGVEQHHGRVVVELPLRLQPVGVPAHVAPQLQHGIQPAHEVERGEARRVLTRLALVRRVAALHLGRVG